MGLNNAGAVVTHTVVTLALSVNSVTTAKEHPATRSFVGYEVPQSDRSGLRRTPPSRADR
jgi:hypothetical protein